MTVASSKPFVKKQSLLSQASNKSINHAHTVEFLYIYVFGHSVTHFANNHVCLYDSAVHSPAFWYLSRGQPMFMFVTNHVRKSCRSLKLATVNYIGEATGCILSFHHIIWSIVWCLTRVAVCWMIFNVLLFCIHAAACLKTRNSLMHVLKGLGEG